jgi:hypothetical protein
MRWETRRSSTNSETYRDRLESGGGEKPLTGGHEIPTAEQFSPARLLNFGDCWRLPSTELLFKESCKGQHHIVAPWAADDLNADRQAFG